MKFELDASERLEFDEWNAAHLAEHHGGREPYSGAIGGRVTFRVTPTSIGQILSVECSTCALRQMPRETHTQCITDFSTW